MVKGVNQDSARRSVDQEAREPIRQVNKIGPSTRYDFAGQNLTAYGGLFPGGHDAGEARFPAVGGRNPDGEAADAGHGPMYQVHSGDGVGLLPGLLAPESSAFPQAGADADRHSAGRATAAAVHLLAVSGLTASGRFAATADACSGGCGERVWAAANVQLNSVTVDTDTTVHTLFGNQMGGRKGYNPKNKGKKSYQPILSFIAETREYAAGALRTGDRPSGQEIADASGECGQGPARGCEDVYARADSGFYCWQAVEAYAKLKTGDSSWWRARLRVLWSSCRAAKWKRSPLTDADGQCEFLYQPEGWGKACRFLALRYRQELPCPFELVRRFPTLNRAIAFGFLAHRSQVVKLIQKPASKFATSKTAILRVMCGQIDTGRSRNHIARAFFAP